MGKESFDIGSSIDDDPYENEHVQSVPFLAYYVMELFTTGASTTVSKTTVAPLERIKILMQTRAEGFHSIGMYGSMKKLMKNEGLRGLYKANGVSIIRTLPHSIFQYVTYEQYQSFLQYKWPRVERGPLLDILASSAASATAFLCTYPLDLARTKYAYQVVDRHQSSGDYRKCIHSGHTAQRGVTNVFKTIYNQGGMLGFYRGIRSNTRGILPYNVIKFYGYEELKRWVPKENQSSVALNLSCGAMAALIGQTVMYPLDVVRRQMQVDILNQNGTRYKNSIEAFKSITRNQGWRQLYAGLSINYIKVVPSIAIGLTAFDVIDRQLHFRR